MEAPQQQQPLEAPEAVQAPQVNGEQPGRVVSSGWDVRPPGDQGPPADAAGPGQPQADTVFRLLVQARKVGSVIGKAGVIVKQIREQTGARIRVVEGVPGCDERVIVISSRNDSRPTNSAQEALLMVHKRVIDGEEQGALGPHGIPLSNLSRLLICQSQAGCLIGKGGAIIKEIRDASGANLKILTPDELPPCALANDRVVQIVGPPEAQVTALQHVSRQLRENPPREWPGGPPPCLTLLSAPAAAPAAPAPVYQQPVQQAYQPAPAYQQQPVYGGQPAGQPVYAPAQPAYQQPPPQQQAYAPAQQPQYAPAQPQYGQPRYR
ncbi:hypothetical protein WJX81_001971 [Elliptochloris bilobata]|uniref:K Homology domain-containing protein n=1 Tax=Elliptochloris bilobata TaxID=381761 RepID=A0AAW1SKF7_9CHLO